MQEEVLGPVLEPVQRLGACQVPGPVAATALRMTKTMKGERAKRALHKRQLTHSMPHAERRFQAGHTWQSPTYEWTQTM